MPEPVPSWLSVADVAAILELSRWGVRKLDDVLVPRLVRRGTLEVRVYDSAVVERVRAERAPKKAAKAAKASSRERRLARLDEIRERAARVERLAKS